MCVCVCIYIYIYIYHCFQPTPATKIKAYLEADS